MIILSSIKNQSSATNMAAVGIQGNIICAEAETGNGWLQIIPDKPFLPIGPLRINSIFCDSIYIINITKRNIRQGKWKCMATCGIKTIIRSNRIGIYIIEMWIPPDMRTLDMNAI
jgi:hypothetical protein